VDGAACAHQTLSGPLCDDGDPCTGTGHCAAGLCLVEGAGCDDGNPCTADGCAAGVGCTHAPAPEGSKCPWGSCTAGYCALEGKDLGLGEKHGCAVALDGSVWCWGRNYSGQLGDGTLTDRVSPVRVKGLDAALRVAAGFAHACAARLDGTVWCWGYAGAIGLAGASGNSPFAQPIPDLGGVVDLVAPRQSACALRADGTVWCWGDSLGGSLGVSLELGHSDTPLQVVGLPGPVAAIHASSHAGGVCALLAGGALWCWGGMDCLGAGLPHPIPGLPPIQSAATAYQRFCAVRNGGGLWCLGPTLGYSQDCSGLPSPQVVEQTLPVSAQAVALGYHHACALDAQGGSWCWGEPFYLGLYDSPVPGNTPPEAALLAQAPPATLLEAAVLHTCIVAKDSRVWCWGLADNIALGAGLPCAGPVARRVEKLPSAIAVAAGPWHTCAVAKDGTVWCWGRAGLAALGSNPGQASGEPVPVAGLDGVVALAAGTRHNCALRQDGTVWCWGANDQGQLGTGVGLDGWDWPPAQPLPSKVVGLGPAVGVAAGAGHSCALLASGAVFCWGSNQSHQLAQVKLQASSEPVEVPLPSLATLVVAGDDFTCALGAYGPSHDLRCWGANTSEQLGSCSTTAASSAEPVLAGSALPQPGAVAAGAAHACAIVSSAKDEGLLRCWGADDKGQAGDGTPCKPPSGSWSSVPCGSCAGAWVEVSSATLVTVGDRHTCALRKGGSVVCWGENKWGQLGQAPGASQGLPVETTGLPEDIQALAAGRDHTCALAKDGSVWCWGWNDFGQLGRGPPPTGPQPVRGPPTWEAAGP
jgi:alpha-tubulin suppressor-like RCC1 family protein